MFHHSFWILLVRSRFFLSRFFQIHTEKYFWNLVESNWNWIVITIFRLIWHQIEFSFVSNQSEKSNYKYTIQIFVWFKKISVFNLILYSVSKKRRQAFNWTATHRKKYCKSKLILVFMTTCATLVKVNRNILSNFFDNTLPYLVKFYS